MGTGDWQSEADRLAGEYVPSGDPTGWFEQLWKRGRDGTVTMPWDSGRAHPLLADWVAGRELAGAGRRAAVVGCGLGADAELVAALGFDTVAFDVSPTAIALAQQRHPGSPVHYAVADVLSVPSAWNQVFDLVADVFTVQALPVSVRPDVIAGIAQLVAPGGSLVLVSWARDDEDEHGDGPPWPVSSSELHGFSDNGLEPADVERLVVADDPRANYWRAEYFRPC